jgi:hypothetical protein
MTTARKGIADTIIEIGALLPEGDAKQAFELQSRRLLDATNDAIAAQAKFEAQSVKLEGDRYVQPKPTETGNVLITHEKKGDEIHYSRHDAATGARQTLAFVDQGKQLEVKDWKSPETVLAALQVASAKWETITVNGNDAYKETAARLAAEHGFKITNPEMQDRIQQLRAVAETKKALLDEGKPEQGKTEARPAAAPITTPAERETRQAGATARAHETNTADGDATPPYRAPEEARVARDAERTVDSDKSRPIQSDPSQSEEVQALRHAQQRVLSQEEQEQHKRDIQNRDEFKRKQSQKPQEESEGESQ